MKEKFFKQELEKIMENHMATGFIEFDFLETLKKKILEKATYSRREILMISYFIGATSKEADALLKLKNYSQLYVKKREDAVWKFALEKRKDIPEITDIIFSTNCGNEDAKTDYNKITT